MPCPYDKPSEMNKRSMAAHASRVPKFLGSAKSCLTEAFPSLDLLLLPEPIEASVAKRAELGVFVEQRMAICILVLPRQIVKRVLH